MSISALDPRVRLVLTALAALCLALCRQIPSSLLGLTLGLALLCFARLPFTTLLRCFATVNVFMLFLWCVLPFTTPGEQILLWGFAVSTAGNHLALLISVKANAVFCTFQALVGDMPPSTVGCALKRLGCPAKLAFLFLVTGRYIHLLTEEWQTLVAAARLRGFTTCASLHAWRTLASLLGLLLVRSHERSRRVYEAMRLRGFTGDFKIVTPFRARPADAVFAFIVLLCLTGITLMDAGLLHV